MNSAMKGIIGYLKEKSLSALPLLLTALLAAFGARYGIKNAPTPPESKEQENSQLPASDPREAICKLVKPGSYCSGTVVGRKNANGSYTIVSAAHCYKSVGETVQVAMRDGTTCQACVVALDRKADCSILKTEPSKLILPYINVAKSTPEPGTKVLHAGYGRHNPGNTERGQIIAGPNADGQVQYLLSVSPGDSGGGICVDSDGNLLSPVCCTTNLDHLGNVWGASPEMVQKMIREPTSFLDTPPMEMPIRKIGE